MLSSQEEAEWFGAETFDADGDDAEMTVDDMNEMVKNLGDKAYYEFCYRFDIDPEDAQEMSWFIGDHYDDPKVVSWLMENHDKFDAEIPKSVKLGFGFGAGLALFQVAVIAGAVTLGIITSKE